MQRFRIDPCRVVVMNKRDFAAWCNERAVRETLAATIVDADRWTAWARHSEPTNDALSCSASLHGATLHWAFVVAKSMGARRSVEKRAARVQADVRIFSDPMEALRVALTQGFSHVRVSLNDPGRRIARYLTWRTTALSKRHSADDAVWKATRTLMKRDADFARIVNLSGKPQLGTQPCSFSSMARSIVYQQLSGKAAGTIWSRIQSLAQPETLQAKNVVRLSHASLRGAGASHAKVLALKDLAARVLDGRLGLGRLRHLPDHEVVSELTQVRGIGPWSAQMQMMFSLGRLNVWPTLDLGVRKGLARLHSIETPSAEDAEVMGERFAPFRSLGAWAMWRLTEMPHWPYE